MAGIPQKPRRKLDAASKEGIADLLVAEKRHLLKTREWGAKSHALVKPEEIEVVLYDIYSVDSFAACCVARTYLGQGVHYEGVTRSSCVQHLSMDLKALESKAVAFLGLCWKLVDISDLCMEYNCRVVVMDTHRGVKEEVENVASGAVFVDENMGAGVMAWNYFFEDKPVPVILRAIEDVHLGRCVFRDGRALEDGLDELEPGFIQAIKEKLPLKMASRDNLFQRFGDLLDDSKHARMRISQAIEQGKRLDFQIFEATKEALKCSMVRTFCYFPAWKCKLVFIRSDFEGRIAESLAADLARSCKDPERCFGAVVDFRGSGARVVLRSPPGGPDVSQVARHYEGSGSASRAFFVVDASEVESMFVKPEIVMRPVNFSADHCLQAAPGDAITVVHRGEKRPTRPFDEWSWCYKALEPEKEGWLPTFAHTVLVAARTEPSGGAGTEGVNEGDVILPLALRGAFLRGTRLSSAFEQEAAWYPFTFDLYKPVQASSAAMILAEAGLLDPQSGRTMDGYGQV
mmetsp:Transcript_65838/g.146250  ORF Transcript_65838/g.146250 Transcript_65838/m.146250 type:complete len:516 (+) Transcript_65838:33-1580(+)